MNKSTAWSIEELKELHGNLYAFLSFMDATTLEVAGKRVPIVVGHVRALKRALEIQLNDHGGREYNPKQPMELTQ